MTPEFQQQIIATFIGSVSGFIFSLVLFYLTEKWKNNRINKDLSKNLQKELEYNIEFITLAILLNCRDYLFLKHLIRDYYMII